LIFFFGKRAAGKKYGEETETWICGIFLCWLWQKQNDAQTCVVTKKNTSILLGQIGGRDYVRKLTKFCFVSFDSRAAELAGSTHMM
jgi:hypothetical protein